MFKNFIMISKEMPQEENEDDLYAYDTVADQTDAEIGKFSLGYLSIKINIKK